jgi:hypothetical protein
MIEIVVNVNNTSKKLLQFVTFFKIIYVNFNFGAGAVGARAASRYGSIKMMRLLEVSFSGSGSATLVKAFKKK